MNVVNVVLDQSNLFLESIRRVQPHQALKSLTDAGH